MALRVAGGALARLAAHVSASTRAAHFERLTRRAASPLPERLLTWTSFFAEELGELLRPDVSRALDLGRPLAYTRDLVAQSAGAPVMGRILAHNFETYLPYDLLVKSDRSSMLHSLELRSPFLDTALIEYVARLPAGLLRRGTQTKWLLRHAFRDLVPDAILKRSKMGFGVPLGAWFRGDLKPYVLDHLNGSAELHTYLQPDFVARLLSEHFSGHADHGHRIWLLLTFQLWLKQMGTRAVGADGPLKSAPQSAPTTGQNGVFGGTSPPA
jgi:asparagine synthase (glutamine-hydrolysing)